MEEILVNMDISDTASKLIKMGLLIGNNLNSKINVIVSEKKQLPPGETKIKHLSDANKLNKIKDFVEKEIQSLGLKKTKTDNIRYYNIPNCETTKKIELVNDFINNHNISYYVTTLKNNKPTPFHLQKGTNEKNSLNQILDELLCPTIIVNNDFNLLNIDDIGIIFSKLENTNIHKYENLKVLSNIFNSKIHLMAVVKPDSIDNSKSITMLEKIADEYNFSNYSINTVLNNNIVEGINFFSEKRILDMIVVLKTSDSKLLERENLMELIKSNNSPIFCYWP